MAMRFFYKFLITFLLFAPALLFGQGNRISGDLRYDNTNQTPLAGVPVLLKTLLGNVVISDTTDSSGYYDMAGYANGNYLLDASVNYSWGGVTSTDALLVTRVFNALTSMSPLRLKAGDVNLNNAINGSDALLISRRVTGVIGTFVTGNFTINLPTVNALGNPLVVNLRVLSTGDVNGSYLPQPTAPTLVLDTVFGGPGSGTATVRFTSSGSGVFERGICWGTSPNPTVAGNKVIVGSGGYGFTQVFSGSMVANQLHYARAYARTSLDTFYSNEKTFFTSPPPIQSCPGTPTVTDVDGIIYNTVQIGTQCWTQNNLKVSKYRNGDTIPTGLINSAWQNTTSGAYAIYNNDPVNDGLYGKLYNHYAVTDTRGLCPTGWHIPSDAEWTTLENHLGGSSLAGGSLKSTAMQPALGGWNPPNTGATNSSGFTALPGGSRDFQGVFNDVADRGHWWSSSVPSLSLARILSLHHNTIRTINLAFYHRRHGLSVRCLKNTHPQVNTNSVTNVSNTTSLVIGEVISEGDQNAVRGFCYTTISNPTISNDTTMNGTGTGIYTGTLQNLTPLTTYYVRAYVINSMGTSYGNQVSFTTSAIPSFTCGISTVSDVDNNTYNTAQIGTQCWTQSNLKVSKYRNGDTIPTGLSNSAWQNTTSGAYAIYNNTPVNDGLYGKLYNHFAVTDGRGLCPTGWHVPTDGEWTTLVNHLGGSSVAGGAMKSTATQPMPGGWLSPNEDATNSSGFTALPGGLRNDNGDYWFVTTHGLWWSSSVSTGSVASGRGLYSGHGGIGHGINNPNPHALGFSIRCLKD